ncbi:hypothetical protein Tco_0467809 [Tanacetum coccineum]
MCMKSGRMSSYARDMIELRADAELKDIIVVAVPKLVGEGFFMCTIDIEYEWKHPRQVVRGVQDDDLGPNGMNSKLAEKEANDMVSSSHATSSKAFGSPTTTLLAEMINDLERQTPDETLVLVDDDGKSLKKVKIKRSRAAWILLWASSAGAAAFTSFLGTSELSVVIFSSSQRGHIFKTCPMEKQNEGTEIIGNRSETTKVINEGFMAIKPSVSLKYPEPIHLETKCMIKGTDQGHWDDICFAVNKLDDQMKFLFTYGIGEVVVKNGDEGYLIPGVYYAPEVTLNVLSIEQLERQGVDIIYEDNTCRLAYMFKNPKDHKFNEDKLRIMHNEYLEKYFESLDNSAEQNKTVGLVSMQDDMIEIKGALYSTKVTTFNEYVVFLNLIKQDEIISQQWDTFRGKFDKKLVEGLGGYLSVYFGNEFGTIGEILGLSKQDGEEVKKCYIKYLDVFTSYYKTARVPNQEHRSNLDIPTKIVEEGKDILALASPKILQRSKHPTWRQQTEKEKRR